MRLRKLIAGLACLGSTAVLAQDFNQSKTVSLEDCFAMAVAKNLDLQVQRYGPAIARLTLESANTAYDPTTAFGVNQRFNSSPGLVDITTGLPTASRENYTENFGGVSGNVLSGKVPTGLAYGLGASMTRNSGSSYPGSFQYNNSIGVNLTQPLLRNFLIDNERQTILSARKDLKISELTLQQQVMTVISQVEQAYYDLIATRESLKVSEKALELAERLLADNKKRVEVGALAQLDALSSEAEVASRRSDLINARRDYYLQQNTLKRLLGDDFVGLNNVEFVPASSLIAVPSRQNLNESWQKGLSLRPDLLEQRLTLEKRDIQLKYRKNQVLPQLDVTGSYGYTGFGKSVATATADLRSESRPNYSVGANFSIPIGNRNAKTNYRITKDQKEQDILTLKRMEQDAMSSIANDVKQAQSSFQSVEATRQARIYAEAALDAEQKKLEQGKSTPYQVLQIQRDLINSQSSEIRALATYNKAITTLSLDEGTILLRNNIKVDSR